MTLSDLYDIRTVIEENLKASLESAGFAKRAFTRKNAAEDFRKTRPRVEIKCVPGQALLHRALCPDGEERPDQWNFSVAFQIVTSPQGKADDNVLHASMCADLRVVMSTVAQHSFNDFKNFPNHVLAETLIETGSTPVVKPKDGVEYSTMTFSGVVAIRHEAFLVVFS